MLILDLAWKSSILLGTACLVTMLLRRKSAALRHLIWSLAFAGLLLLPLLTVVLPALHVPVGDTLAAANVTFRTEVLAKPQQTSAPKISVTLPPSRLDWRFLLTLAWLGGASVGLGQMFIGWLTLERLRLRARAFAMPENGVALLESASRSMPMAYGLFRPVIFLPSDAKLWTAERLRIVLQHELAHVKRGDCLTHVMARTALSLYWWNPLAWWAWREFLKEQERAADDQVLNDGASGVEYAGHLLEIARSLQAMATAGPVVAMAHTSPLAGRLEAILDSKHDRSAPGKASVVAAMVVAVGVIMPLAAMQAGQTSLLQAGDDARDKGKFDEAKAVYDKLLSGKHSGPDAARIYIHRGVAELSAKEYQAALGDFDQAQANDLNTVGEALMWEAITQQDLKNLDAAASLFESAVKSGDPRSLQTATSMDIYARFLDAQGQHDQAKGMRETAHAIRKSQSPVVATSHTVFRAGGDVQSPVLLSKIEPEYTTEARVAGYDGVALMTVVVGPDGKIHDVQVLQPLGLGLDQKAVEAVSQWTFKPGVKGGKPVAVRATIEVHFRLL